MKLIIDISSSIDEAKLEIRCSLDGQSTDLIEKAAADAIFLSVSEALEKFSEEASALGGSTTMLTGSAARKALEKE